MNSKDSCILSKRAIAITTWTGWVVLAAVILMCLLSGCAFLDTLNIRGKAVMIDASGREWAYESDGTRRLLSVLDGGNRVAIGNDGKGTVLELGLDSRRTLNPRGFAK